MKCRSGCAACCIVISISSIIPGMLNGKPAGIRCVNLDKNNLCSLHGTDSYPDVCGNFKPSKDICGNTAEEALNNLDKLEKLTGI